MTVTPRAHCRAASSVSATSQASHASCAAGAAVTHVAAIVAASVSPRPRALGRGRRSAACCRGRGDASTATNASGCDARRRHCSQATCAASVACRAATSRHCANGRDASDAATAALSDGPCGTAAMRRHCHPHPGARASTQPRDTLRLLDTSGLIHGGHQTTPYRSCTVALRHADDARARARLRVAALSRRTGGGGSTLMAAPHVWKSQHSRRL